MTIHKWLKIEVSPNSYRRRLIQERITIGRAPNNDVVISDLSISAHQATLWAQKEQVWIKDEGSTNGTSVNDLFVQEPRQIYDGDRITVGYVHLLYCIERDLPPDLILDIRASQEVDADKISNGNDIEFILPCDINKLEIFWGLLEKKLASLLISDLIPQDVMSTLKEVLQSIICRVDQQRMEYGIKCRLQNSSTTLNFIISELVHGSCAELWKGNIDYVSHKGIDEIEYCEEQNLLILSKYKHKKPDNRIPELEIYIRYYSPMWLNRAFPIDIVVSHDKTEFRGDSIHVVPVFPGCICCPPSCEIDISTPNQCRFWLTPLTLNVARGLFQTLQRGRICDSLEVPFKVKDRYQSYRFIAMSFWVPMLLVILTIVEFPLKREVPAIILQLILLFEFIGGFVTLAIVMGCIFLLSGIILHFKGRPKISEVNHIGVRVSKTISPQK